MEGLEAPVRATFIPRLLERTYPTETLRSVTTHSLFGHPLQDEFSLKNCSPLVVLSHGACKRWVDIFVLALPQTKPNPKNGCRRSISSSENH